jgi:hypothetical protein
MSTTTLGLAFAAALAVPAPAQEKKGGAPFRVVDIPTREHGYGNFKTQVISSQEQLDAFLKASVGGLGWNNREGFLKGLKGAKIDFTKEALVLLRQTEGSGSNKVTLLPPELKGDTLVCRLKREVPEVGTADIADHCFALAVSRGRVAAVRYEVQGHKGVTLKVAK